MKVELTLNGTPVEWDVAPGATLLEALRQAGTESAVGDCAGGDCGACVVLLDGQPVRSCLVPALQGYGCTLTTIEGLDGDKLLQEMRKALADSGAAGDEDVPSGVWISLYAHLRDGGELSEEVILEAVSGRL